MREIKFYTVRSGISPVEAFLDTLNDKQVEKVLWVLKMIQESEVVPKQYFKKLINTKDIWEVRVQSGNSIFRLLGFVDRSKIILTNGFAKKTRKTPAREIRIAESRKKDYLERKEQNG